MLSLILYRDNIKRNSTISGTTQRETVQYQGQNKDKQYNIRDNIKINSKITGNIKINSTISGTT
jgi:hypothetical protein